MSELSAATRSRVAILGAGSRGAGAYGSYILRRPDLAQVVATAAQGAMASSLPTAGLTEVSRQLAMGVPSRDQYQPLVNLRLQTLQMLTLACSY